MKKVFKVTLIALLSIIALIVIAFIVLILVNKLNEERDTGVYQENGVDVLYIADCSHDGKGHEVVKILDNNNVLMYANEDTERNFKPIKQGKAFIVTDEYFGPDYRGANLFEITVDKNLNISYDIRRTHYLLEYESDLYSNIVTVEKAENVITLSEKNIEQLAYEFENVYGVSNKCDEPDTTDVIKLCIDYGGRRSDSYYISNDSIIYLGVNHDDYSSQWYEFTPEKCCNLDKINELLNEFLTN